ncbi:reverse transcriptase [Sesbania bispinosa]|nr:reverse transcriptase [Sesbania bispinosa]
MVETVKPSKSDQEVDNSKSESQPIHVMEVTSTRPTVSEQMEPNQSQNHDAQPADYPFGPWNLVKKQVRKKPFSTPKVRKSNSDFDNQGEGSRFSMLNNLDQEDDQGNLEDQNTDMPKTSEPKHLSQAATQGVQDNHSIPLPTPIVARVWNPSAGKNPQNLIPKK